MKFQRNILRAVSHLMKIKIKLPKRSVIAILTALFLVSVGLSFYFFKFKNTGFDAQAFEAKCSTIPEEQRIKCWQEAVEELLESRGLDIALDAVPYLYDRDPVFAKNCHDFVHILGKEAYKKFSKKENFQVSSKTSFCSYGFYHGFMESLVSDKGDPSFAREFCSIVNEQLSKESSSAYLACYHGIGHGWTNVHDERLWGDEQAMVKPALKLCEEVTEDPHELKICATGVFDSISLGYYNNLYGLKMREDDPMWLCRDQEEKFKEACYMDLMPAVLWLGDYDLAKSLQFLGNAEPDFRNLVSETLADNSVRFLFAAGGEAEDSISVCRTLNNENELACIKGLASGAMQFGKPSFEYESGLIFCRSGLLNPSEKEPCYKRVYEHSSLKYSREKMADICGSVNDVEYKKECLSFIQ